jgi:hypothetical protein
VDVDVQTFYNWVTATNTIINTINTVVVTANSAGSITTGNAILNGHFQVNTGVIGVLQGGVLGAPAALNVGSNVNILGNKFSGNADAVINIGTYQSVNATVITGNVITAVDVVANQTHTNAAFGNSSLYKIHTANEFFANHATGNNASFANVAATALLNVAGAFFSVNSTKLKFNGTEFTSLVPYMNISNNDVLIVATTNINFRSPDTYLIANVTNDGGNCEVTFSINTEGTVGITIGASNPNNVIYNDAGTPNGHNDFQFYKGNSTIKVTNAIIVTSIAGGNHSGDRLSFTGPATLNATTANSLIVTTNVNANQVHGNTLTFSGVTTLNVMSSNSATMNAMSANNFVSNTTQANNFLISNTGAPTTNVVTDTAVYLAATDTSVWNLHAWAISTYRGAEYLLTVHDNNSQSYQMVKLTVVHNGSAVQLNEYSVLATNATYTTLSSFDADINVSSVTIKYQSASGSTIVRGKCTRIQA